MGKTVFVKATIGMAALEMGKTASAIVGIRPDVAQEAPYIGAEDGACLFTAGFLQLNKEQALRHAAPTLLDLAMSSQEYNEILLYCEDTEFKLNAFLHRQIIQHPGWEDIHATVDTIVYPYNFPIEEVKWGKGLSYKITKSYIHSVNPSIVEFCEHEGELYSGLMKDPKKAPFNTLKRFSRYKKQYLEGWTLYREIYHVHSEERVTIYIR